MAQPEDEIDIKKFHVGFVGNPPQAMVIQIPVAQYAEMGPDGIDMFYGKMRRMEATGAKLIAELWAKKSAAGIIKTATPLGVH